MSDPAVSCGCITCGDEAVPMVVVAVDEDAQLARCVDPDGRTCEVDAGLLEGVAAGARLMVHAGTAIAMADAEPRP